jgi:AAA domain
MLCWPIILICCHLLQVGATALGMNSPVLLRHVFDVVIVDEAGQMTLPATIAPLLKARAFVLVRGTSSSATLGVKRVLVDPSAARSRCCRRLTRRYKARQAVVGCNRQQLCWLCTAGWGPLPAAAAGDKPCSGGRRTGTLAVPHSVRGASSGRADCSEMTARGIPKWPAQACTPLGCSGRVLVT